MAEPRETDSQAPIPPSGRFDDALGFALRLHRSQFRKGTSIPYISHLLAVAGLVQENGGSEDEAIGALLHDAIEDVLVVGVPDERWGQKVVAVVSLAPGANFNRDDFDRVCREKLAGYKLPRAVVISDGIRRSPAGKADYAWAKTVAA